MIFTKYFKRLQSVVGFRAITPKALLKRKSLCLYAGDLPGMKGYEKFTGLSLTQRNRWHLRHDVTQKYPLPDNCVDMYQSEDVFEHIPYERLPAAIAEIYRILKPGGLFRLAMPDYRCDVLADRCVKDAEGRIVFDPRGGGRLIDGGVVDSGHIWFPVYESTRALLAQTPFTRLDFRHYYNERGEAVTNPIDYAKSYVKRTPDHDPRVREPYRPMSIVVDCYK